MRLRIFKCLAKFGLPGKSRTRYGIQNLLAPHHQLDLSFIGTRHFGTAVLVQPDPIDLPADDHISVLSVGRQEVIILLPDLAPAGPLHSF